MKDSNITDFISDKDRAAISRCGRKPLIAAYRVAHEGVSVGPVAGIGRTPKRWNAARVEELAYKLSNAPVFIGHQNGVGPRRAIGYVLNAKWLKSNSGAEAVAIVAVEDPRAAEDISSGALDTASIEAELTLEPKDDGWDVAGVEKIAGLALASSREHAPGFPRAALIAFARELDDPVNTDSSETSFADSAINRPAVPKGVDEMLRKFNLDAPERAFVLRRVSERGVAGDAPEIIADEVNVAVKALDEAKRIYRRPPVSTPIPFERRHGPIKYTNPDDNDLIPRRP